MAIATIALLAASRFFTNPAPLEMPRAEAFFVREAQCNRLEDRFMRIDLWTSQAVDGRWVDGDGREFLLATLAALPPAVEQFGTLTRAAYAAERVPIARRDLERVRAAVERIASVELSERGRRPDTMPRRYKDVDYWHAEEDGAVVCAFLPEGEDVWRLAVWTLAAGDSFRDSLKAFEEEFLRKEFWEWRERHPAPAGTEQSAGGPSRRDQPSEADLLRADARHSVFAYDGWRATDAATYVVLDDLPPTSRFVDALTNELPRLHRAYAAAMPTPLDGTNALCVARVYASRREYLDVLEADGATNMEWSAAYWSPLRRELVAYLPTDGDDGLLRTIRHEAFHQYLSYATATIPCSAWLNEGYAQYFEDPESLDWSTGFDMTPELLKLLAADIETLLAMGYKDFYAGSDFERRVKYRLAWSLAVFLERGDSRVRFDPFRKWKADYFETLFETRDPRQATAAAFRRPADMETLRAEWRRWWTARLQEGMRKKGN